MRKIILITFLLWIKVFAGLSQTHSDKSIDGLKSHLKNAGADTNRLNVLLQISESYTINLDSALNYAQQANALSKLLKNKKAEANSHLLLARIFAKRNDHAQGKSFGERAIAEYITLKSEQKIAESYMALAENYDTYDKGLVEILRLCESAEIIFHEIGDKKNEASTFKKWGEMLMFQGKMDEGLKKLEESLKLYQSIKYVNLQDLYSLIGINYSQSGKFDDALKYGLMAVKTAEELKDTSQSAAVIYNYLAVTYQKLGQLQDASENLKKGFAIAERGTDAPLIIMLATNISHMALRLNKPDEALFYLKDIEKKYPDIKDLFSRLQISSNFLKTYLKLSDYKNAAVYCTKLLAVSEKYKPDDPNQILVYSNICKYYFATKQYNNAAKYLPLFKEVCQKYKFLAELRSVHLMWFGLDSIQGNYLSAISHFRQYKSLSDSLFNETKSQQISQLQIQYDTEKKDKDIRLLTQEGLLNKSELRQTTLIRNVTLAGLLLLLLIIILMISRYRLKQRQQEEINKKNNSLQHLLSEKEWLLKEVHHRVKNNLQTVMSLLSSQSAYLHNDAALLAIKDSQHRVQAMSLIHQKLYNSENFSTIDMPVYIAELIQYMRDSFNTGQRIRFDLNIASIELDVSQAVPVGLILNEAITNAIKYAFPENRDGIIAIKLQSVENGRILLTIFDNGVGMPADFNPAKPGSLGLSLIKGLSQDLDGSFSLENNSGTLLKILFVLDTSIKRITTFTSLSSTTI